MPIQKFAPMTKNFPTFDCDAHVTEPPWLWERAKDWLTKDEYEALKNTIWYDPESDQLIVNGRAGAGIGSLARGPGITAAAARFYRLGPILRPDTDDRRRHLGQYRRERRNFARLGVSRQW